MNKLLTGSMMLASLSVISLPAMAETLCTEAAQSEWISQADMQDRISEMGYKIKEFKVTEGNCYEIYGWDEQERRVEIYFNPVDASIVKQEVDD